METSPEIPILRAQLILSDSLPIYIYIIVQLLLRFCSLSYLDLDRFIQDLHDCEGGWGEGYAWFAFKIEKSLYYKLLRDGALPGH